MRTPTVAKGPTWCRRWIEYQQRHGKFNWKKSNLSLSSLTQAKYQKSTRVHDGIRIHTTRNGTQREHTVEYQYTTTTRNEMVHKCGGQYHLLFFSQTIHSQIGLLSPTFLTASAPPPFVMNVNLDCFSTLTPHSQWGLRWHSGEPEFWHWCCWWKSTCLTVELATKFTHVSWQPAYPGIPHVLMQKINDFHR